MRSEDRVKAELQHGAEDRLKAELQHEDRLKAKLQHEDRLKAELQHEDRLKAELQHEDRLKAELQRETIAATILSGNSAALIAEAVRSVVEWCDVVLLIDTGITDERAKVTAEIARAKFRSVSFPWRRDFAASRLRERGRFITENSHPGPHIPTMTISGIVPNSPTLTGLMPCSSKRLASHGWNTALRICSCFLRD